MNKKIFGILIMMLFIATIIAPVVATIDINDTNMEKKKAVPDTSSTDLTPCQSCIGNTLLAELNTGTDPGGGLAPFNTADIQPASFIFGKYLAIEFGVNIFT